MNELKQQLVLSLFTLFASSQKNHIKPVVMQVLKFVYARVSDVLANSLQTLIEDRNFAEDTRCFSVAAGW